MGVMSCSRKDCESVLCVTYVYDLGYVCRGCQDEFKEYLRKEKLNPTTKGEIRDALETFMETSKGAYTEAAREMDVDEFFSEYTSD